MKLSICIPTYNRVEAVKRKIDFFVSEGILNYDDIELIISDNCSTDGTADKIVGRCEDCGFTLNVNTKNLGLIGNVQKLTDLSKGEYIWYVCDDDELKAGILAAVYTIINQYNIGHLFVNHSVVRGQEKLSECVYRGRGGYFDDGIEMFTEITRNSFSHLGVQMFLTANIYRHSLIKEADSLAKNINENDNLALPLGYSLYTGKMSGYLLTDIKINDSWSETSWSDRKILVMCRDMPAICDKFSGVLGCEKEIRKILVEYLPIKYPELIYCKYKRMFKRDNYALKMYLRHFPYLVIYDSINILIRKVRRIFQ